MKFLIQLWIAGDKSPVEHWQSVDLRNYPNTMPEHVRRRINPYVNILKNEDIKQMVIRMPKSDYIVKIIRDDRSEIEKIDWLKPY